jgi:hypothetical protein
MLDRMWRWAALALVLAGCTNFTFDENPQDLPLVGAMPDTPSLPHLNHGPASLAGMVYGVDGTIWVTFTETIYGGPTPDQHQQFVHLSGDHEEFSIAHGTKFLLTPGTLYFFTTDDTLPAHTNVSLQGIGAAEPDARFTFPGKKFSLIADFFDQRFLWFQLDEDQTTFRIQRRDGLFRDVPLPDGVDPLEPTSGASYNFNLSGQLLFVQTATQFTVHHTDTNVDVELMPHDGSYWIDDAGGRLVFCSSTGVLLVPFDGSAETVLDSVPCDTGGWITAWLDGALYTSSEGDLKFVKLDGSPPEQFLGPGLRLLGMTGDNTKIYSTDSAQRYVNGAGDGWIGDWRFMERGLDAGFSRDTKKVRWLEHAAQMSGIGDLTVATIPGGAPLRLTRNVRQYHEHRDGRLIAASNHAFRGAQNRVVMIDEARGVQQWVASSASEYATIPGTTDLLIDVVSGPSTYDIVRVPLPDKLP